jgi:periplasmic copper chaperone A
MRRTIAAALGIGVLALAVPAWAHVTVSAPGATRGGSDQLITFRVPVEKDVATVGVTVALPTKTPITSVDVLPLAGWTHTEKTVKLAHPIRTDDGTISEAVSQVSWKAHDGGLKPGEFGEFTIIAGQLPDVSSLTFAAIQTYQDGSVVRWNERAAPGTAEPESPAPVLELSAADPAGGGHATAAAVPAPAKSGNTGPTVLAVVAIVVAAAALGVAVVASVRRKSGS